jgi:hypothetical protein
MSLIKLNDRAVKDVTEFGSITSLGSLTHISTATASASASIEFTSGIDSTYKEYIFYFVNIHPQNDGDPPLFNLSTDGGSNYNVVKTTTVFRDLHNEGDTNSGLAYRTGEDLAQSTAYQYISAGSCGNDNDQCFVGYLQLFNPSSTTFVKHFICKTQLYTNDDYSYQTHMAGYANTTSAVNAIDFKFTSGNIDAGQILLFGVN